MGDVISYCLPAGSENKLITTESDVLLDQDQVQLRITPNKSDGFTVMVLTFDDAYNEEFELNSDSTLFDFLHEWEMSHGIDVGKSRSIIQPDGSTKDYEKLITSSINSDTPLTELVNQNIEWYSFRPGYENNKVTKLPTFDSCLTLTEHLENCEILRAKKQSEEDKQRAIVEAKSNESHQNKDFIPQFEDILCEPVVITIDPFLIPYPIEIILNLQDLFDGDRKQYKLLKWCMQNRGWVLVQFPDKYIYDIHICSKLIGENLEKYMKTKGKGKQWKTICDNFGYANFKNYKSVLRVYTNEILKLFKTEYPKDIIDSIEKISNIMDEIASGIIRKTGKIWSDGKEMDELCLDLDDKRKGFGMIDYVLYQNKDGTMKQKDDEKHEYEMIKKGNMNVDTHIDPGLFSISFYQFNEGLQLLNRYPNKTDDKEWVRIPEYKDGKYGVLWSGQYSFRMNNENYSGIHRVDYNENKPRLTGWYEVCIKEQIPNRVFDRIDQLKQK